MRFNPPPNWPQPPDGWSPPPGWQPDASWPQPPWGWPLWVEDDEPTVSMSPSTAQQREMRRRSAQVQTPVPIQVPWYRRTTAVVLFLVFFFPVGLVLLWMRTDWSAQRRTVVTGIVAVFVLIAAASHGSHPTTTTQLNPTTRVGTGGSSSGADASASSSADSAAAPGTSDSTVPRAAPAESSAAAVPAPPAPAPSSHVAPPPPPPSTQAAPPPPAPPTTKAAPPPSLCGAPSNPYGYNFCDVGGFVSSPPRDICSYFNCIGNFWNGRGYMVECNDGTYSMSGGISGACSYHKGEDRPVYSG
jgi:hypothetical protein